MLHNGQFDQLLPVYDKHLLNALTQKATALHHLQQFAQSLSDSDEECQSIISGTLTKLLELHYLYQDTSCKKRMFRRLSTDFMNRELISKSVDSKVFLSQSKYDSSFYCIKSITPKHAQYSDLLHTLHYAAYFKHENLIRYHSCWIELKMKKEEIVPKLYIQLELCDSTSFLEEIQKLNNKQRINVALSISQCLQYLHSNKIAYGNLKPSNILFSFDGIPKIDPTSATFSDLTPKTKEQDLSSLQNIICLLFKDTGLSNLYETIKSKVDLSDIISTLQTLDQ